MIGSEIDWSVLTSTQETFFRDFYTSRLRVIKGCFVSYVCNNVHKQWLLTGTFSVNLEGCGNDPVETLLYSIY